MKRRWLHLQTHNQIHEIYETNEHFVYDNPMNAYYLANDYKKRKIIEYINANIHEVQLKRVKLNYSLFVSSNVYALNSSRRIRPRPRPLVQENPNRLPCHRILYSFGNIINEQRQINYEFYRNNDTAEFMKYRQLRYLEKQRAIDNFKIHTIFNEPDNKFCMTLSAGFRKILKRKAQQ